MLLSSLLLACTAPADADPVDSPPEEDREDSSDSAEPACAEALFTSDEGQVTDLTQALTAGTPVTISEPGRLEVCPGTWFVQLRLEASVEVAGMGSADATVLSGGETHTIVEVAGPGVEAWLHHLTLDRGAARVEEGNAGSGGALRCLEGARVELSDAVLSNNTAYDGGGAYARDGCHLDIRGVTFLQNRSVDDGGALRVQKGSASIRDSVFRLNVARDGGAALFYESDVFIERCVFMDNESTDTQGGALLHYFAELTMRDTVVSTNQALSWGGGLALFGDTSLERVELSGNRSTEGGGIVLYTDHGALDCVDCSFSENQPDDLLLYQGASYSFGEQSDFRCDATGCR